MIDTTDNSRVRLSIVGVITVALFAALFARLWFLQVVSGEEFKGRSEENSTRPLQTEAPRGRLLSADGDVLVGNATLTAVTVDRAVPDEEVDLALGRLAELFGVLGLTSSDGDPLDVDVLRERYDDPRKSPFKPAVIATDVPPEVVIAITERAEDFPHVSVVDIPVRTYPNGSLAAHVLGYTGEINEDEFFERQDQGYELGDTIGRVGAEAQFEDDLRGAPREEIVEVDPANQRVGDEPLEVTEAVPGNDVVLTIDADVQRVAEESLAEAITQARTKQNPDVDDHYETFAAPAGAVVVLDVTDGSVVAMASSPTYDPTPFIGGIPQPLWDLLNADAANQPLNNRAAQGLYAPGSTFKLVTAIAALEEGLVTPTTPFDDPGAIEVAGQSFRNAGGITYGIVQLREALAQSVDTYFYELGRRFWICYNEQETCPQDGEAIQHVARRFGFEEPTGIPLAEAAGRVPDDEWQREFAAQIYTDEEECARVSVETFASPRPLDCEELRAQTGRWLPGYNINLSIGQGDLLVTPLQLANAYAAFANGGTLWQPRIAAEVRDPDGDVVRTFEPVARRDVALDPQVRASVMEGLRASVVTEGGTAELPFDGFPHALLPVAAKTGTAEVDQKGDTSLFAAIVPANEPRYVVVAVVEEAGFGSRVAAPVARAVIEELYDLPLTPIDIPDQAPGRVD